MLMRIGKTPRSSVIPFHPAILLGVSLILASVPLQAATGVTTYAADCLTPKAVFNLGETVCAKAEGLSGFRFGWVDADGFIVQKTTIMTDPQTDSFTLPTTDQSSIGGFFTANNLGS